MCNLTYFGSSEESIFVEIGPLFYKFDTFCKRAEDIVGIFNNIVLGNVIPYVRFSNNNFVRLGLSYRKHFPF